MPGKEPLRAERLAIVSRCVEHHLDHSLDTAVSRLERTGFHAKAARDRRAYLLRVEPFPFDLAALQHVGRQGLEDGFPPQPEPESLHVATQPALPVADCRERCG